MNPNHSSKERAALDILMEKIMQITVTQKNSEVTCSRQMQAVLIILNADAYLMKAVSPFVNVETETIYWDKILKLPFGSGHKGAIRWAYGVWTDEMPYGNCFDGALSMSPALQVAVLEALCLRWGLRG